MPSFIVFADPELSSLLGIARRNDLAAKLMKLYGFPGAAFDDDEIVRQLRASGRADDANQYSVLKHEAKGLIAKQHDTSPLLLSQIADSVDWARRFNPIRLALEHASLRDEVIDRQ